MCINDLCDWIDEWKATRSVNIQISLIEQMNNHWNVDPNSVAVYFALVLPDENF